MILIRKDALKVDDPLYGAALGKTWAYLSSLEKVDFGLDRFRMPPKKDLPDLLPPVERAPVLLPAHLVDVAHPVQATEALPKRINAGALGTSSEPV